MKIIFILLLPIILVGLLVLGWSGLGFLLLVILEAFAICIGWSISILNKQWKLVSCIIISLIAQLLCSIYIDCISPTIISIITTVAIIIIDFIALSTQNTQTTPKIAATSNNHKRALDDNIPNVQPARNPTPQKSDVASFVPTQAFTTITIPVKGVLDEERTKIRLGHEIQNILLTGITHNDELAKCLSGTDYAIAKLMKSTYPFSWDKSVAAEIREDILLVEYFLPSLEDVPEFLEIEYKNEQPISVAPNEKKIKVIWTESIYKIVIRSLYELFSSPSFNNIKSISFNGIVKSLDLSTGNVSEKCIMSVIVHRADFESLDLTRVDARQCFKRFKGISAHDLATLTPIPPLMKLNKNDRRFSDSYEVISTIESGENLAAMDWRDFENLIRELFEKEFSESGSEVKITRASKDGGVDAVVFDPDPIRGGKIIIQAKRYTNIVGVSAVRDLYGTVMNEGATKGILVTTSDYGADSYNFAKDKPLTLLNGANLLHLLGKHGCHAHINIADAKKILKATQDE